MADAKRVLSKTIFGVQLMLLMVAAVWVRSAMALTFTVTKTADTDDGACNADCSLREAVGAANLSVGADGVTVPAGTYPLSATLEVNDDLVLTGAGAGATVLEGGPTYAVLEVSSGTVAVSALSVRRGASGIVNDGGTITLDSLDVSSNGIGVYNEYSSGTVTIRNSSISGNGAGSAGLLSGGGIVALDGSIDVVNTTISSNGGGAVTAVYASVALTNVTIAANSASSFAAVGALAGPLTLTNTLLADNEGSNCFQLVTSVVSNGHNLDTDGSCLLTGPGDISNIADAGVVFLGDNGGPTTTHALAAGSPALDAGDNAACPSADQRGVARPVNGTCDIGAFEGPPCFGAPDGAPCDTDLTLCDGNVGSCSGGTCVLAPGNPCPPSECATACRESTASCYDPAGVACTDDGNPCTSDSCAIGTCVHATLGDRTPCDDGVACNGIDQCLGGACFHSSSCSTSLPLDGYQCWRAKDLGVPAPFVGIEDLPVSDALASGTLDVQSPALLCNPADIAGSGINDPSANLCCYRAKGQRLNPRPQIDTDDPLGTRRLEVKKPQFLCQPCMVSTPTPAPTPTRTPVAPRPTRTPLVPSGSTPIPRPTRTPLVPFGVRR